MMIVNATQQRGTIQQFPEGTVGGQWRWLLIGPAPATKLEDTGDGALFQVDESIEANRGEYIVQVQRLDANGVALGNSQASAPFTIGQVPPDLVNVEVAGAVTVQVGPPVVNPLPSKKR